MMHNIVGIRFDFYRFKASDNAGSQPRGIHAGHLGDQIWQIKG